jgi:hypothetical protein
MNAVFYPWPIQEGWEGSDGIPESGRRIVPFGVQGRFFARVRWIGNPMPITFAKNNGGLRLQPLV